MECHNTLRVYPQDEPPFRHNLFKVQNSGHRNSILSQQHPSPGSVEMKVVDFVPNVFEKNAPSSNISPHSSSSNTKTIPTNPEETHALPHELQVETIKEEKTVKGIGKPHITKESDQLSGPNTSTSREKYVGQAVKKYFDGFGWYYGKVKNRWDSQQYGEQYHVLYNDGDSEDITLNELLKIIVNSSPSQSLKTTTTSHGIGLKLSNISNKVPGITPTLPPIQMNFLPSKDQLSENSRRRKISLSEDKPSKYPRIEASPRMPPLPLNLRQSQNSQYGRMKGIHPSQHSKMNQAEVFDLTGSDDETRQSPQPPQVRKLPSMPPTIIPRHTHPHTEQFSSQHSNTSTQAIVARNLHPPAPCMNSSDQRKPKEEFYHEGSIQNRNPLGHNHTKPTYHSTSNRQHQPQMPSLIPPQSRNAEHPGSLMGNDPLSAFNYMLYTVVKKVSYTDTFGRSFVNILTDEPRFLQCMDLSRLGNLCLQRNYKALSNFISDVVKIPTTARHLFPSSTHLHTQSDTFTSAITQEIRDVAKDLQALEIQLK